MNTLKQQTLDLIRELTAEKEALRKFPPWPNLLQLRQRLGDQVKEALRELIREGKATYHCNVNGIPMFVITDPQQHNEQTTEMERGRN